MKRRVVVSVACGLLVSITATRLCAQRESRDSISYTVPLTVEYERFLADSVLDVETRNRLGEPTPDDVEALKGDYGIPLHFYVLAEDSEQNEEYYESLVEQLSGYFDFRELLDTDFALTFCLDGVTPFTLRNERLATTFADSSVYQQRAWFGQLRRALKTVEVEKPEGAVPIMILDMDVIGFASTVGHEGFTDGIFASSQLLQRKMEHRTPTVTLAHLIASYLGVKPLWYNEQGYGDLVEDTPCHDSPNFGASLDEVHLSLCTPMEPELAHNLMDNLNDAYRAGMTAGQVKRLCVGLSQDPLREGLLSANCRGGRGAGEHKLTLLDTPVSDFALSPIPADLSVELVLEESSEFMATYSIVSAVGAVMQRGRLNAKATRINVSQLAPGQYYVLVQRPEQEVQRKSLTVAR